MKQFCSTILVFFVVGCTSTQPTISLTKEQAKTIAMQLANDKADLLYHCRPFQNGEPAQLVAGHWIWIGRQGIGNDDIDARVELAADGSTNNVDCKVLVNILVNRGF